MIYGAYLLLLGESGILGYLVQIGGDNWLVTSSPHHFDVHCQLKCVGASVMKNNNLIRRSTQINLRAVNFIQSYMSDGWDGMGWLS